MVDERPAAAAGRFYEGSRDALREQVESAFTHELGPGAVPEPGIGSPDIAGLVSPHAGLPYSGHVAAHGVDALASQGCPDVLVIVGPNHTGRGDPVAVSDADRWQTPLGSVPVHDAARDVVLRESERATSDEQAHREEHALEVQLPFIQVVYDDPPAIVPIVMADQSRSSVNDLGDAISAVSNRLDESVVGVASTDLTHYEPQGVAEQADRTVIERIEALDSSGLLEQVERQSISMCGPGPTAAVLSASVAVGADEGRCLQYATSGDVTGSTAEVVGYCSAIME